MKYKITIIFKNNNNIRKNTMKITKILVALSFLFAVSTAHAGEMTVTGSMQATYQSEIDRTTGNPLGMDREITFSGSTELITVLQCL